MKKVLLTTLGCKVNQYESASFRTSLEEAGHHIVRPGENADIVIVNTCAVTAKAGAQSRQAVRKALRENSGARVVITGCYAEIAAQELSQLPEVTGRDFQIIGNSEKDQLVANALSPGSAAQQLLLGTIDQAREICRLPVRSFGERTRAYLRVQDGCESYCTYCIVPYTRGPSRSLPVDEVLEQVQIFSTEGYREIVLTGIHLGNYGKDLSKPVTITDLVDLLSSRTPHIRYRISSLEPTEITPELLLLIQNRPNLTPHLHIPLQAGDDEILKRMNRHYSTSQFSSIITRCREAIPEMAIGIDILVGFPGESSEKFENSVRFLESLPFTYLHVFPYSKREGTPAATFTDSITKQEKDRRVSLLRNLGEQKKHEFYQSQIGKIVPVLVEGKRDTNGLLKGFSDNYIPVHFAGSDELKNNVVLTALESLDGINVQGRALIGNES